MSAKPTPSKLNRRFPPVQDFLDRANPFARVLDLAADAIVAVDGEHSIVLFNRGAEAVFGYSATEVRGKPLTLLLPCGLAGFHRKRSMTLNQSGAVARLAGKRRESIGRRKDGSEFPIEVSSSKVKFEGRTILSLVLQDVTPRALTEERLRAALREKEVLLEEVHHRVKNNLQVITSLLGLQARSIKDSATRAKFEESRYRIKAMAILHEILDESSSLAEINFSDYIRKLAAYLVKSYGAGGRIRMQTRLEPLVCHRDIALPCGLIVNELLSNTFKYAFPGGKAGEVQIELRRDAGGTVYLLVADNGIGLPRDWHWDNSPTLGLRLVRTLARQIDANVQIDRTNGAAFSIAFRDGLPRGL